MRTVRSKAIRYAMYRYFEGKCQLCGTIVDDFEIDHRLPYALGGETEPENLQLLCRHCNRKKGTKLMIEPRTHQAEVIRTVNDVLLGKHPNIRRIIPIITQGGGKSALANIAFSILHPKIVDKLVVIVPNDALAQQAEEGFLKTEWQQFLRCSHTIRRSTNEHNPCKTENGYVTTWQAVLTNPKLNLFEFPKNALLVLDEFHHYEKDGPAWQAIKPLVDRAKLTIMMTGTLFRHDGKMLGPLEYEEIAPNRYVPMLEDTDEQIVIRYKRADALREQAIIHTEFIHNNGSARYKNRDGKDEEVESIADAADPRDAIFAALHTEYAEELLREAVAHFRGWLREHPRSKMLVIAPRQKVAEKYLKYLTQVLKVERCGIATTDYGDAKGAIKRFKVNAPAIARLDVLVTVGMAYEGLDVPAITHLALLTHIRSKSYLEQAIPRAARNDPPAGPYVAQRAFVFGPDDALYLNVVNEVIADQDQVLSFRPWPPPPPPPPPPPRLDILPLNSALTEQHIQDDEGRTLDRARTHHIQSVMNQLGIEGVSALQMDRAAERLQMGGAVTGTAPALQIPQMTPSEEENRLRGWIENYTRKLDRHNGDEPGTMNGLVKKRFGKPREQMGREELTVCWTWLQKNYGKGQ